MDHRVRALFGKSQKTAAHGFLPCSAAGKNRCDFGKMVLLAQASAEGNIFCGSNQYNALDAGTVLKDLQSMDQQLPAVGQRQKLFFYRTSKPAAGTRRRQYRPKRNRSHFCLAVWIQTAP